MNNPNGKKVANLLMNLPVQVRKWLLETISPDTLGRWCRQNQIALRPYKTVKDKVLAIHSGKEELSDLAKYEKINGQFRF